MFNWLFRKKADLKIVELPPERDETELKCEEITNLLNEQKNRINQIHKPKGTSVGSAGIVIFYVDSIREGDIVITDQTKVKSHDISIIQKDSYRQRALYPKKFIYRHFIPNSKFKKDIAASMVKDTIQDFYRQVYSKNKVLKIDSTGLSFLENAAAYQIIIKGLIADTEKDILK